MAKDLGKIENAVNFNLKTHNVPLCFKIVYYLYGKMKINLNTGGFCYNLLIFPTPKPYLSVKFRFYV